MNCIEANEYIMKYFDGSHNDIENAQLKQHLKSCSGCNDSFENLKEIFSCIDSDNAIEPPCDFEVNVMKKINALEVTRKKRADGVLIFIYSFVTVLITVLAVSFMARFNGVNIFEIFSSSDDAVSSFPDTVFTLFSILNAVYHVFTRTLGALIQVISLLANTYYFMIAALLILFITVPQVFAGLAKHGGRDEK